MTAKIMIFIKSWPLSLLNILYDETGCADTLTAHNGCLQGKHLK